MRETRGLVPYMRGPSLIGPTGQGPPGQGRGSPPYRLQTETMRSIGGLRRFVFSSASGYSMDSLVGWERHSVGSIDFVLHGRAVMDWAPFQERPAPWMHVGHLLPDGKCYFFVQVAGIGIHSLIERCTEQAPLLLLHPGALYCSRASALSGAPYHL